MYYRQAHTTLGEKIVTGISFLVLAAVLVALAVTYQLLSIA
jgi:hypothetical protein